MLERLADLGMLLAERAAQDALEAPRPRHGADATKRPDPNIPFARMSRCVRETLALEARIAAGKIPAAHRETPEFENDPRRPMIKRFVSELIEQSPQPKSVKAGFRNQLDPLITEYLESDLEQDHPPGAIVLQICKEFGLPCTASQLPDELLKHLHREPTAAEKAAAEAEAFRRIYRRDPPKLE